MRSRRRPFTLLEILIAMLLVSIAIFPLLAPHTQIVKEEVRKVQELQLGPKLNKIHSDLLISLHERAYSLSQLEQGFSLPLDLTVDHLPYRGTLTLKTQEKSKKSKKGSAYLLNITYLLNRTDNPESTFQRTHQLFIEGPPTAQDEKENPPDEEE